MPPNPRKRPGSQSDDSGPGVAGLGDADARPKRGRTPVGAVSDDPGSDVALALNPPTQPDSTSTVAVPAAAAAAGEAAAAESPSANRSYSRRRRVSSSAAPDAGPPPGSPGDPESPIRGSRQQRNQPAGNKQERGHAADQEQTKAHVCGYVAPAPVAWALAVDRCPAPPRPRP